jgi:leader peptidase (prepilin peptidase)/N-methyltransferase
VTAPHVVLVAGCVAAGGLAGACVPAWVARLPEPSLADGEHKLPYAELARWRLLPLVAGGVLALVWGLLAWQLGADLVLPVVLYVAMAGVLLCYVDLRVQLLPNAVVLPSYAVVAGLLVVVAAVGGSWDRLGWAAVGGGGWWGFLALLRLAAPSGMGFGDVKLGGVLGLVLGWFGLPHAVIGIFLAFLLGGVVSLGLVAARRVGLRTAVPFGPFLLAGCLAALLVGDRLAALYLGR